ncbi:MAG: tRNA (adenosine(37)-N6)-threonylcarbamoyltransferase complex ATPase subunit type 1 TsaE [Paracoccaceae bacterium]
MPDHHAHFHLTSPDQTAQFGRDLGRVLGAGDCVLLEGSIGAGKTHFARSLIQSLLEVEEDVPSPTFTLVQTYDTVRGEVWHADLYRLSMVDEVFELGLEDAFDTAITLIEWPDCLGDLTPSHAMYLTFETDVENTEARNLSCRWTDDKWTARIEGISFG